MKRMLAAFVLLVVGWAPVPAWAARLVASPQGDSVWLLNAQGAISRIGLRDRRATTPWNPEAEPAAADIALSSDGATLFTLVPASDGRTTQLRSLDTASGQELSHWDVRGQGRFLVVTSDGARACVVALKPSAPGRRASKSTTSDDDWTLIVVELATGRQTPPVAPGLTPLAVTLMEAPGSGPKVLLSAGDRVATYGLEPLRVSWFYKSPGENNDVVVPHGSSVVGLLRGSSLALIDPGRRPTEGGRVQLGDDDATSVIALPARGRALAVSGDGRLAAVLHDDGAAITWVDLARGIVVSSEKLEGHHDMLASSLVEGDDAGSMLVALASSTEPSGATVTRRVDAPHPVVEPAVQNPPPVAAVTEPPAASTANTTPGASAEPAPEKTPANEEKFELKVIVPEPPRTGPVVVPPAQLAAPPGDPTPRGMAPREQPPPTTTSPGAASPETGPSPVPASPPPLAPAPILPPRAASGATLSGHLTGGFTQAREVLFYGPGNIIKLHSRAMVEQDGAFSLPLPPPGSYRVVVSAGPGAHLFTRPEFRSVTVVDGAGGLEGIDFEVRGAIK